MLFVQKDLTCGDILMLDKTILRHPLFLAGLVIKFALILLVIPEAASSWYVPFIKSSFQNFSIDPWSNYLEQGGTYLAFPYGYAMWIPFLPLCSLFYWLELPIYYGYSLTLLFFDFLLLCTLRNFMKVSTRTIMLLYWCSPIVLFATYWLGLNDILPVTLLCISILLLRDKKSLLAGSIFGLAVSAKLSMGAALPLVVFYLWRNKANRVLAFGFFKGMLGASIVLFLPICLSSGAISMLLRNPEMQKIYQLSVRFGDSTEIYILGVVYVFMLYIVWRIGRFGFGLLVAALATAFFLFLLLTPAAPGWFVWVIPFLVYLQVQGGRKIVELVAAFSLIYVLTVFLFTPIPNSTLLSFDLLLSLKSGMNEHFRGILLTSLTAFGGVLCWRLWRDAVRENDIFGLSRRPIVLGIAGDSGAGKDTLVDSLTNLFGSHSVVSISGDDYHFWDRHKPMWHVMTHLNPQANELEKMGEDIVNLSLRRPILARHYDHGKGIKSKPYRLAPNDFVMVSGLHALYLPSMRECYDVSVYLDIDEGLRHYFKLRRDVGIRGHSREKVFSALARREPDACRFIRPQRDHADLVLSLQPIHPLLLDQTPDNKTIRTKLQVQARRGGLETALRRVLVGICGMHVDMDISSNDTHVMMTIEGDIWAEDIALSAKQIMPDIDELLDLTPVWEGGMLGLMQLFVISHLYQVRVKKLQGKIS
ncbi:uridine kinase [Dickeya oryzae]|uniref:uridine kinase n=1 Tax=Dickeya oryzae TaxID=1240404 RepID=UPI002097E565|nr:uridine kinase [Dickeya oryzae]MCO7253987.1 uridine kinase [Dickeya oryzae]